MVNIFSYLDYKKYLKDLSSSAQVRGFQASLANAAQCQGAYLSRVLNSDPHLTQEQAAGISNYLHLSESEGNYFLDLVSYARAGSELLKSRIRRRLNKTKSEAEDLSHRYKTDSLEVGLNESVYYSSWLFAAVHIATGISDLQTSRAISTHLEVSEKSVLHVLHWLEKMNLIKQHKDKWVYGSGELHLPRESMMTAMNHANWRHRALMDIHNPNSTGLHYSVVHSHAIDDFDKLKEILLSSIDQSRKVVGTATNEDMSVICIDCFRL